MRAALEDPEARVGGWAAREIHGSLGPGAHVYRITGEARTRSGARRWSLVLKVYSLAWEGLEAASADPLAWDYWKREWPVYRSGWLDRLERGLRAPRCLGTGESADGHAQIAMEDLTAGDVRPSPPSRFATVAQHLGQFSGTHLLGEGLAKEDW